MFQKISLILILMGLVFGCSSQANDQELNDSKITEKPTSIEVLEETKEFLGQTKTPTKLELTKITDNETKTDNDILPTNTITQVSTIQNNGVLNPSIVRICPTNQEVMLSELMIDSDNNLLIKKLSSDQSPISEYFSISGNNDEIQSVIFNHNSEKDNFKLGQLSPDGKWIISYTSVESEDHKTVWINSIDGTNSQKLFEVHEIDSVIWISDFEVIHFGLSNPDGYMRDFEDVWEEFIPLSMYNIHTLVTEPLSPLPDDAIYWKSFFQDGNLFTLYYIDLDMKQIMLYDYHNDITITALSWLAGTEWVNYNNTSINIFDDITFISVDRRPYGFDLLVFNTDTENFSQDLTYNNLMTRVILPGNFEYRETDFKGSYQLENNKFIVENYGLFDENYQHELSLFDYINHELIYYCISFDDDTRIKFAPSPDGRFLAINKIFHKNHEKNNEILILDTQTGQYSIIEGYQIVVWGKK